MEVRRQSGLRNARGDGPIDGHQAGGRKAARWAAGCSILLRNCGLGSRHLRFTLGQRMGCPVGADGWRGMAGAMHMDGSFYRIVVLARR